MTIPNQESQYLWIFFSFACGFIGPFVEWLPTLLSVLSSLMWEPARTLLFDVSDRPRTFCPRANPFKYLSTGATYSYKYLFFWWRLLIGVCVWFCTLFLAKPYLVGTYYKLLNIRFRIIKENRYHEDAWHLGKVRNFLVGSSLQLPKYSAHDGATRRQRSLWGHWQLLQSPNISRWVLEVGMT